LGGSGRWYCSNDATFIEGTSFSDACDCTGTRTAVIPQHIRKAKLTQASKKEEAEADRKTIMEELDSKVQKVVMKPMEGALVGMTGMELIGKLFDFMSWMCSAALQKFMPLLKIPCAKIPRVGFVWNELPDKVTATSPKCNVDGCKCDFHPLQPDKKYMWFGIKIQPFEVVSPKPFKFEGAGVCMALRMHGGAVHPGTGTLKMDTELANLVGLHPMFPDNLKVKLQAATKVLTGVAFGFSWDRSIKVTLQGQPELRSNSRRRKKTEVEKESDARKQKCMECRSLNDAWTPAAGETKPWKSKDGINYHGSGLNVATDKVPYSSTDGNLTCKDFCSPWGWCGIGKVFTGPEWKDGKKTLGTDCRPSANMKEEGEYFWQCVHHHSWAFVEVQNFANTWEGNPCKELDANIWMSILVDPTKVLKTKKTKPDADKAAEDETMEQPFPLGDLFSLSMDVQVGFSADVPSALTGNVAEMVAPTSGISLFLKLVRIDFSLMGFGSITVTVKLAAWSGGIFSDWAIKMAALVFYFRKQSMNFAFYLTRSMGSTANDAEALEAAWDKAIHGKRMYPVQAKEDAKKLLDIFALPKITAITGDLMKVVGVMMPTGIQFQLYSIMVGCSGTFPDIQCGSGNTLTNMGMGLKAVLAGGLENRYVDYNAYLEKPLRNPTEKEGDSLSFCIGRMDTEPWCANLDWILWLMQIAAAILGAIRDVVVGIAQALHTAIVEVGKFIAEAAKFVVNGIKKAAAACKALGKEMKKTAADWRVAGQKANLAISETGALVGKECENHVKGPLGVLCNKGATIVGEAGGELAQGMINAGADVVEIGGEVFEVAGDSATGIMNGVADGVKGAEEVSEKVSNGLSDLFSGGDPPAWDPCTHGKCFSSKKRPEKPACIPRIGGAKRVASQSSTWSDNDNFAWSADLAVDGQWSKTAAEDKSCAHTNYAATGWWQVDMGTTVSVGSVNILAYWPSTRLNGATVSVSNFSAAVSLSSAKKCGTVELWKDDGKYALRCTTVLTGRYLIIHGGPNYLIVCEAEAWDQQHCAKDDDLPGGPGRDCGGVCKIGHRRRNKPYCEQCRRRR